MFTPQVNLWNFLVLNWLQYSLESSRSLLRLHFLIFTLDNWFLMLKTPVLFGINFWASTGGLIRGILGKYSGFFQAQQQLPRHFEFSFFCSLPRTETTKISSHLHVFCILFENNFCLCFVLIHKSIQWFWSCCPIPWTSFLSQSHADSLFICNTGSWAKNCFPKIRKQLWLVNKQTEHSSNLRAKTSKWLAIYEFWTSLSFEVIWGGLRDLGSNEPNQCEPNQSTYRQHLPKVCVQQFYS